MREFTTAATRGKPGVRNAVDIEFKLDDDVLTAHAPTTGQVALFIQHGRGGGMRSVTSRCSSSSPTSSTTRTGHGRGQAA